MPLVRYNPNPGEVFPARRQGYNLQRIPDVIAAVNTGRQLLRGMNRVYREYTGPSRTLGVGRGRYPPGFPNSYPRSPPPSSPPQAKRIKLTNSPSFTRMPYASRNRSRRGGRRTRSRKSYRKGVGKSYRKKKSSGVTTVKRVTYSTATSYFGATLAANTAFGFVRDWGGFTESASFRAVFHLARIAHVKIEFIPRVSAELFTGSAVSPPVRFYGIIDRLGTYVGANSGVSQKPFASCDNMLQNNGCKTWLSNQYKKFSYVPSLLQNQVGVTSATGFNTNIDITPLKRVPWEIETGNDNGASLLNTQTRRIGLTLMSDGTYTAANMPIDIRETVTYQFKKIIK